MVRIPTSCHDKIYFDYLKSRTKDSHKCPPANIAVYLFECPMNIDDPEIRTLGNMFALKRSLRRMTYNFLIGYKCDLKLIYKKKKSIERTSHIIHIYPSARGVVP